VIKANTFNCSEFLLRMGHNPCNITVFKWTHWLL